MKSKKIVGLVSLAVLLVFGVLCMKYTYENVSITYDGSDTDVTQLMENPSDYDLEDPDGVADIIVKTNLEQTRAVNSVAAVVFDYRGFDTIGESFILLAAISGSYVILRSNKKRKEEVSNEVQE